MRYVESTVHLVVGIEQMLSDRATIDSQRGGIHSLRIRNDRSYQVLPSIRAVYQYASSLLSWQRYTAQKSWEDILEYHSSTATTASLPME